MDAGGIYDEVLVGTVIQHGLERRSRLGDEERAFVDGLAARCGRVGSFRVGLSASEWRKALDLAPPLADRARRGRQRSSGGPDDRPNLGAIVHRKEWIVSVLSRSPDGTGIAPTG
jgi:hypothetical protein